VGSSTLKVAPLPGWLWTSLVPVDYDTAVEWLLEIDATT